MIKKLLILVSLLLFCAGIASAQKVKILGEAKTSSKISTSGILSTNTVEKTLPGATVTILNADGSTATIYSDAVGSAKSNPYSASLTDATYDFFIQPGVTFSVRISGTSGGVTITPFTRSGYVAPGTAGFSLPLCAGSNDTSILSAANTAGGKIEIPNGTTCASNTQSISAALQIDNGGLLKPITGQTVTISGVVNSDPWQHFTNATAGLGTIILNGAVNPIPDWWTTNAVQGTTNMTTAIQAAIDSLSNRGGKVTFQTETYLTGQINITHAGVTLEGQGSHTANGVKPTTLVFTGLPDNQNGILDAGFAGLVIRNLYLEMITGTGGAAIQVTATTNVLIENVDYTVSRGSGSFGFQFSDFAVAFSGATNASPVVITLPNHHLTNGQKVRIAGGTGNWIPINSTFVATVLSANTFSVPLDSTGFGAVTGTLMFESSVTNSTIRHCSGAGAGVGFFVGAGSTSVHLDNDYPLGSTGAAQVEFYNATYCQVTAGAADTGGATAYGYLVNGSTGITFSSAGAENNGKGYLRITGGSTGITVIGGRGVGNNVSADATIGSFAQIDTGGNYNNSFIGCTDTSPNGATSYSIQGGVGTLQTNIIGYNATSFPKGYGGDATWKSNFLSLISGGELQTGSLVAGIPGGGGILTLTPKTNDVWGASLVINVGTSTHIIAASFTTSATCNMSASGAGLAGQLLTITTEADASGTVTTTFTGSLHSSGTQATTASHFSTAVFQSDGTRWVEIGRTTNLA